MRKRKKNRKKKENDRRAKKNNNKGLAFSESEDNLRQKTGSRGEVVPLKKPKKKKNLQLHHWRARETEPLKRGEGHNLQDH